MSEPLVLTIKSALDKYAPEVHPERVREACKGGLIDSKLDGRRFMVWVPSFKDWLRSEFTSTAT